MEQDIITDIRVFEDSENGFMLRVLLAKDGQWFMAQDVASSAGYEAKIGKPSPTREINQKYKATKKIRPVHIPGRATPPTYEVLCLNTTGVWLLVEQIKKLIARKQTSDFMLWFERQVIPALKKDEAPA